MYIYNIVYVLLFMFTIEFKVSEVAYVTFILDPYTRGYLFEIVCFSKVLSFRF